MDKMYHCEIHGFNIKEAFEVLDLLSENDYSSVSCAENKDSWFIEIINTSPISIAHIKSVLWRHKFSRIVSKELENVDWLKKCFENFKPISVGGFLIYGSHLRGADIPANKVGIEISAATAFGSGEHPTTNRCLCAIESFYNPRRHKKILDIGCGSCILSIACAKLGANDISSYDNDPEAVKISNENIEINNVAHKISVYQNEACEFADNDKKYDLIVANILSEPLVAMRDAIVSCLVPEGVLIISGFNSDDGSVAQAYAELQQTYRYNYRGWTTLVMSNTVN